jgi:hypothetical protein
VKLQKKEEEGKGGVYIVETRGRGWKLYIEMDGMDGILKGYSNNHQYPFGLIDG